MSYRPGNILATVFVVLGFLATVVTVFLWPATIVDGEPVPVAVLRARQAQAFTAGGVLLVASMVCLVGSVLADRLTTLGRQLGGTSA